MTAETFDLVVLGGGSGGYACALRAAELGKRVALVERDERLGGTCLLRGCVPTKALLESASVLDHVNRSAEWGIEATGSPDWPRVLEFGERIVDKKVKGLTSLVTARGIDVVRGEGRLVEGPAVVVGERTLAAPDVVIATGSRPKLLPGMQIGTHIVTSDQALWMPSLPSSAVVIGAGAVGVEFASLLRSFGAEVTVLEALPRMVPLEDEEISKQLDRAFRRRGIAVFTGVSVTEWKDEADRAEVAYGNPDGSTATVSADMCLVAVGRGPVTEGVGLEEAGVQLDRGYVKVDGTLQSTAPRVWAVGDVAATPLQFAHTAFLEGMSAAERIAGLDVPEIDYAGVPRVTFSTPEIASVGLTEAQARDMGHEVEVKTFNLQILAKANILGEGGLCKVVSTAGAGPILGIHLIGPHATDLIAEAMLVTNWEAGAAEVSTLIHPHPTMSEALGETFLALAGKPLHSP
ncbi:MAG TPA: dihydrolipoyl dehydrogenase [Actinomycetota bacterium]|nr:dihydrolipoyl dehydrogenase [Actinomycetota bacterium]